MKKLEDFPLFDHFDDVMGHRDSIDIDKMSIWSTSVFDDSTQSSASPATQDSLTDDSSDTTYSANAKKKPEKRRMVEKSGAAGKKGGKKKRENAGGAGSEEWESFTELWSKSMEQENSRFERSMEVFQESQRQQMQQTNDILSGFKDIFKDLLSK